MKNRLLFFWLIILPYFVSCRKYVEIDLPIDQQPGDKIFATNYGAISAVTGIYGLMSKGSFATGVSSISVNAGLYADELVAINGSENLIYTNNLNSTINGDPGYWTELYSYMFRVNSIIGGINSSLNISPAIKLQLIGELKFIRAFLYFYLVNLYGDVPLLLSSDYKETSVAPRTAVDNIYKQIVKDLLESQDIISKEYLDGTLTASSNERIRPNYYAVTALLARVYLFMGMWKDAEEQSNVVLSRNDIFELPNIDDVFLKNSNEAIWQLQTVNPGGTEDGKVFVLNVAPSIDFGKPFYLNSFLVNDFQVSDLRRRKWVGAIEDNSTSSNQIYYYALKYKSTAVDGASPEYLMVFRLAEQYLIRSEARANQNNISGTNSAVSDLNKIRERAGLGDTTMISSKEKMLAAILGERRHELFTEWGHRFLDLKRGGNIDDVMSHVAPAKGGVWSSYKSLFPIPQQDILSNPSLSGHQNAGYN